ncbi:ABC transporter permease [Schaalia sp. 19OD2882]|uniref:ABC transporter permease n=1 Tax=Schaalia sp. 19OD2882 TaxID=2794089 RepID=UPI001C1F1CA0|nr:ABC transporter permease [Schaalia sp. 19OD2882]QWW19470.1 ABC transporter permease [Schaalia sp. 19OD2882]
MSSPTKPTRTRSSRHTTSGGKDAGTSSAGPLGGDLLGRLLRSRDTHMSVVLVAVILLASWMVPRFLQARTMTFLLMDVVAILLMALPMTLVMVAADIDLSVASTAGLSSAALGVMVEGGVPFWAAIGVCLVIGVACGAFNGVMTAYVGLPALAVTIGTLALYRGLALVVIGDRAVANFPEWATGFVTSTIGGTGIPWISIPLALIVLLFWLLLHRTPWGRQVFALGHSLEAARFVGIDTRRTRALALVLSGLMASVAGIFWTLRYSSARSDNAEGLELTVIAAIVFGGVSVFGGKGSIWGSVCGVFTVGVINYALRLDRVPDVVLVTITGLLLIFSVVAPSLVDAWKQWRHRAKVAARAAAPTPRTGAASA